MSLHCARLAVLGSRALPRLVISGNKIFDEYGNNLTGKLRGVNIQGVTWIDFGDGYVWPNPEQQFRFMQQWGINIIRFCFEEYVIRWEWPKESTKANMDNLVQLAAQYGIYVIFSGWHLHSNSTFPFNNDMSAWTDANWNAWKSHWVEIAKRYKGKNVIYDLLNEPLYLYRESQQVYFRDCIDAIRVEDPDAIVMVEQSSQSSWGGNDLTFEQTHPINRPNIIFSGHAYYSSDHFFIPPNNSLEYIRSTIDTRRPGWGWCLANNRPVFIGETNANRSAGLAPADVIALQNMYTVYAERYAGWATWQWMGSGGDYPLISDWNATPTDQGLVLQEYLPVLDNPRLTVQSSPIQNIPFTVRRL